MMIKLPTKKEIINTNLEPVYQAYKAGRDVCVAIHCFTFNQKQYIHECIDSFLNQQVNFNVKIYIHDDASTDGTTEIVQQYHEKYPDVVVPVIQKTNTYKETKRIIHMQKKLSALGKEKYVALCEGDDYWNDPLKLFLQVYALNHNNASFCVHRVLVSYDDSPRYEFLPSSRQKTSLLSRTKFVKTILKEYSFQTSSYVIRKDLYDRYLEKYPDYLLKIPTDDEAMLLYFGSHSDVIYLHRIMSNYRKFLPQSWSSINKNVAKEQRTIYRSNIIYAIEQFNADTSGVYNKYCVKKINNLRLLNLINENNYQKILDDRNLSKAFFCHKPSAYIKKFVKHKILGHKYE